MTRASSTSRNGAQPRAWARRSRLRRAEAVARRHCHLAGESKFLLAFIASIVTVRRGTLLAFIGGLHVLSEGYTMQSKWARRRTRAAWVGVVEALEGRRLMHAGHD